MRVGHKVKVGVVGLGRRGLLRAAAANVHPETDLRAVADIDPEAEDIFRLAGFRTPFSTDPGKMLDETDLDAAFICAPPETHLSLARKCREKSLDVFIDSPLADSLSDCREMVKFAQKEDFIHALGFHFPYVPVYQMAKQFLRRGVLDEVIRFRATLYHTSRFYTSLKEEKDLAAPGAGKTGSDPSSVVYLLHWLFGLPDKLYAGINRTSDGSESGFSAVLDYPQGLSGALDVSWVRPYYPAPAIRVIAEGTGGTMEVADEQVKIHLYRKKAGYEKGWTSWHRSDLVSPSRFFLCRDGVFETTDAFIQAVKSRKLTAATWPEGYDVMRTIEAIRRSSGESRKISLSEVG